MVPEPFDAESSRGEIAKQHVLAICEGSRSRTFSYFKPKFGAADFSLYGLDGEQLSDMVLGPRVKSLLPDPMAVLLTVAQNRFLLNSLNGEGFLNMRLTDLEAKDAVGINPVKQTFSGCIQSEPCLLELGRGATSSAAPTAPCSCPPCCAGPRSGRGCRKDSPCSAMRPTPSTSGPAAA